MSSIWKYIISGILALTAFSAEAQIKRWLPTGLRLGVDAGALGQSLVSPLHDRWEVQADIDVDRLLLTAEYGMSTFRLDEPTYRYENEGSYFRVGPDLNFLADDRSLHVSFFGLRYARSSFSDRLDYDTRAVIESETGWPPVWTSASNDALRASWFELNAGVKARVYKPLYMGFTVRYKFLLDVQGAETLRPYFVPGFGRYIDNNTWGFSYYVSFRIPVREKVFYPRKPKKKRDLPAPKPAAAQP